MSKKAIQIVNLLKNKKLTLSTAESCTGGMLAQTITSVRGASKIFKFGVVTYSNYSKTKYLKVSLKIIKKYGTVSKQCCQAMVNNLSKISKSKLNIAITGIAGPKGGSKLKPIGLVYIGIKKGKKNIVIRNLFRYKSRISIQKATVKKALNIINSLI